MRTRRPALVALLALTALLAPGAAAPSSAAAAADDRPRNVILMIPDGCGPTAVALARMWLGRPLALDSILVGAVETRSADSHITDSAAGATAFASGVRTRNGTLGVDSAGRPVGTLLEAAATRGLGTGLVTTARLTDATSGAFAAHLRSRRLEDEIATQMLEHRVDVLLGGGWRHWRPDGQGGRRDDGRDLLAEARRRGYTVVLSPKELAGRLELPLLGLFAENHLDLAIDRDSTVQPSLVELTKRAITLLSRRDEGFFLLVEGARIDDAAHDNDPAALVRDVIAYDDAVRAALAFARRDGRTLVVSCSDHETGGLGLALRIGGRSPYIIHPESLQAARTSIWRMSDSILAGRDPVGVAEQGTGFRTLSDQERAVLRSGAGSRDRLLETLSAIESRRVRVGWSSGGHSAADVGLHAFGPGRDRFVGLHRNSDLAPLIAALLDLDLEAETARLRQGTGTLGSP